MDVQRRYYQEFANLKRDARYIDLCHARTEQIDRYIRMFGAITSSSAIAGWAVWNQAAVVWAIIIAASQVLGAVQSYLPYRRRLAALAGASPELNALTLTAEGDWFKVSRGYLTEEEIHQLHMELKKKKSKVLEKNFSGMSLPEHSKFWMRADHDTQEYFAANFGGSDEQA